MNRKDKEKRKIKYTNAKETASKQTQGFTPKSLKLPKEVSQFKFTSAKNYRLDVVPFVTKEGNPMAEPDLVHWERTLYVHEQIGPENDVYTCPAKSFGKKCPVCELSQKYAQSGDQDKAKGLFWKKKQLIAVIDNDERDKGIQIYYGPYVNGMGELILNKVDASDDDSPYRNFFHLEEGLTLVVKTSQESFQGRSYFKPVNLEMVPRKKKYSEDMLDEAICLDDCVAEVSYEKLKSILLQSSDEDDEEDEETKEEEAKEEDVAKEEEEEEESEDESFDEEEEPKFKKGDLVIYKKKEYEVIKVSPDGSSLTLEHEDGTTLKAIDPDDCKEVPSKKSEKPKKEVEKAKPKKKVVEEEPEEDDSEEESSEDDDNWEDDDEEEEEEESAPKKKGKK